MLPFKKYTYIYKFHDEIDFGGGIKLLDETDHVWMLDTSENRNFVYDHVFLKKKNSLKDDKLK